MSVNVNAEHTNARMCVVVQSGTVHAISNTHTQPRRLKQRHNDLLASMAMLSNRFWASPTFPTRSRMFKVELGYDKTRSGQVKFSAAGSKQANCLRPHGLQTGAIDQGQVHLSAQLN